MTAVERSRWDLHCDSWEMHDDPSTAFYVPVVPDTRAVIPRAEVRRQAVKAGWTHVRSQHGPKYDRDYCPLHAENGQIYKAGQEPET